MTWDPPGTAEEMAMLEAYLELQRDTIRRKTADLDAEQLARPLPPSAMTLGGLLMHLAVVEDSWVHEDILAVPMPEPWASVDWHADPDWEWHVAARMTPEQIRAQFEETVTRCRDIVAGRDPAELAAAPNPHTGESRSVRWVMLHLIEEYARHAGHADLLRESVDGSVGL